MRQPQQLSTPTPTPTPEAPSAPPLATTGDAETSATQPSPPPEPPAPRAPATPRNLTATAQSASEIALAWDAAAADGRAVKFEIFRGDHLLTSVQEPRFVVTGLRAGTQTCYAVATVSDTGQRSPRTRPVCCTTLDTTAPSAPEGVTATARPNNEAAVEWAPSTDDVGVARYEVSRAGAAAVSVPGTAFSEAGLTTLKEYCYSVVALDRAGNRSQSSAPACVTIPDTHPPSVPAGVAASPRDEHAIAVSWSASRDDVGVARYEVSLVDADAAARSAETATTTTVVSGFAASTTHCFVVRACDAAGNCSERSSQACATTPDLTPPSPPAVVAKAPGDDRIELRWKASTDNVGVSGYEVFRGKELVHHGGVGELTVTDTGLRPTVEYCYRVHALDAAGNRSLATPVCATPPDLKPPTSPASPAAVPVSSTQVFLAWDPSRDDVGVAGYEVLRDEVVFARVMTTRARQKGLQPNHGYCYKVRAFDAAGNRSPAAGPFCTVTAKSTDLSAPSDLRVRRVSATNVLLQWEPSEDAGVTYVISVRGGKQVGRTGANTFTPSGRLGAKADCYRVTAVDATGRESTASNEICASTLDPISQR